MKKSKLKIFALIAEIVSGVAVLITVILLLYGVWENTNAVKVDTYDRLLSDMTAVFMTSATDDELAEAIRIRRNEDSKTQSEFQQFIDWRFFQALYLIYERAYIQWESGNMDDYQFERFRVHMCSADANGMDPELVKLIEDVTSQRFTDFTRSCLSEL